MDSQDTIRNMREALTRLAPVSDLAPALARAGEWLDVLADRFRRPASPWVVAVCGPTGAGKSHIVNFLAGKPVSPSGYRRPSTLAPVLAAPAAVTADLATGGFLPRYTPVEAPGGAVFEAPAPDSPGPDARLYLVPLDTPPWAWPENLAVIDTPDFDSVLTANQAQAEELARRADAVILVAHQAKYADQSTWDFLSAEAPLGRPLLLVFNRVTAAAARDDFQARLNRAGLAAPMISWPEEMAVGQVGINAARRELTAWLEDLGRRGSRLATESGRRAVAELGRLWRSELAPPLARHQADVDRGAAAVTRITREWMAASRDRVLLNLPGETRESLMKNLSEVVRRSDIWAKPRHFLIKPLALAGEKIRRLFGETTPKLSEPEQKLADRLAEAGREALVAAVRDQARALAEAAGRPVSAPAPDRPGEPAPAALDFTPDEIRDFYTDLSGRLDHWLRGETERLLAGLPLGQKAAFYLVQFLHLGLVAGLWFQTGGVPGTEVLLGGALGPVVSKLTGAVISRETLAAFEERAAAYHHQELARIFGEQGRRYQDRLAGEAGRLAAGRALEEGLAVIEREAARLWA